MNTFHLHDNAAERLDNFTFPQRYMYKLDWLFA